MRDGLHHWSLNWDDSDFISSRSYATTRIVRVEESIVEFDRSKINLAQCVTMVSSDFVYEEER